MPKSHQSHQPWQSRWHWHSSSWDHGNEKSLRTRQGKQWLERAWRFRPRPHWTKPQKLQADLLFWVWYHPTFTEEKHPSQETKSSLTSPTKPPPTAKPLKRHKLWWNLPPQKKNIKKSIRNPKKKCPDPTSLPVTPKKKPAAPNFLPWSSNLRWKHLSHRAKPRKWHQKRRKGWEFNG